MAVCVDGFQFIVWLISIPSFIAIATPPPRTIFTVGWTGHSDLLFAFEPCTFNPCEQLAVPLLRSLPIPSEASVGFRFDVGAPLGRYVETDGHRTIELLTRFQLAELPTLPGWAGSSRSAHGKPRSLVAQKFLPGSPVLKWLSEPRSSGGFAAWRFATFARLG